MPKGVYKRTSKMKTGKYPKSVELRKKYSLSHLDKKYPNRKRPKSFSKEHKRKISENNAQYWLGKKRPPFSEEWRKKISEALRGEKSYNWTGGRVKYSALHKWVGKWLKKGEACEHCGKKPKRKDGKTTLQWANKSRKYLRDLSDWILLCPRCHCEYDDNWVFKNRNVSVNL